MSLSSIRKHASHLLLPVGATMVLACGGSGGGGNSEGGGSGDTGIVTITNGTVRLDVGGAGTAATAEGGNGCAEVNVMVDRIVPTIMVVVDQSGSMTSDFQGQDRWDAVYSTLMDPTNGVIAQLENDVRFGLTLYTSMNGDAGGQCPMLTEVPPALGNFAAIDAVYGPANPIDETPTGESLDEVVANLVPFAEPGPKAIVLATDGLPDTCAEPNPQNGQPEALSAASNSFAQGIKVFAISVGPDVGQQHLQELANVGVGLPPNDPVGAPFYEALNAQQLVDAFQEIIGAFVSCTLTLEGLVDLSQMCEGTVLLDGVELECGTDWTLLDEQTLELLGNACTTLQDGDEHTVAATFPCGAVTIP